MTNTGKLLEKSMNKIDNLNKEITQLKTALKHANNYISKLRGRK